MKSQRVTWLLSLLTIATLLLSACGPAATPTAAPTDVPPPTEAAPTEAAPTEAPEPTADTMGLPSVLTLPEQIAGGREVEITVIGKPADSKPEAVAAWQAGVDRFTQMYPNVTIVGSDYAYAPDTFAALVAGNQVPTLFEVYLTDPSKMIDQGVAADLTSFFDAQKLKDVFNPNVLAITSKDGKVYGIPRFAYAMGLAYNIKMLKDAGYDAPPTNWPDLATAATKLTNRDEGIAGFSFITDGANAGGWQFTTIAYGFGLKNTDIAAPNAEGKVVANFANDATNAALEYVKDLRWENDVLPRENYDWPKNGESLGTGKSAMVVMAGDQLGWIKGTYSDVDMSQFGFAPLPAGADGKSVSLVGGNIAMISSAATADQIEAAAYFRLWQQLSPAEIIAGFQATKADPNAVVGNPVLPLYVGDFEAKLEALQKTYANLPVDNYAGFLNAVSSGQVNLQPEPLVAGQEYYAALGGVVSTILTDENADPAQVVEDAQGTFQTNVLDQMK